MIPPVLDVRTLSIIMGTVILSLGFCMITYIAMRRTYQGFREWTVATLMMGAGLFLGGMRDVIPDFPSIVIANGLLCSAMVLYYEGQKHYFGQKSRVVPHVVTTFFITAVLMYVFSSIYPDVNIRIAIISFGCAWYFFLTMAKTIQSQKQTPERLNNVLLAAQVGILFLLVFRGVYFLWSSNTMDHYQMQEQVHAMLLLSIIGFSIFFIVTLIQMNSSKLENDLLVIQKQTLESEEQFRLLSEQSMMCIAVIQDRAFKYFNEAFQILSGYSKEELFSMTFTDIAAIVHPEYRAFAVEQGRKKMAGELNGVAPNYVYKVFRKTGEEKWVQQFSKSVLWKGRPADFLTLIDITPQKSAEEELKDSEEKYRVLVENAMDAIFIAQNGVIKYCNPVTEDLSGYTPEEACNIRIVDLVHPDDLEMVMDRHARRSQGEILPNTYSHRFITKGGTVKWGQLNSVRIQWEGKDATLNFLRDITRQQELESQLQQAHKLEAIGTLSGGIAHEFNNLLSIILGNAEMAMDDIPDQEPARAFLNEIKTATIRGGEIVRQLLSFSRPSLPKKKPVDISSCIRETMSLLRASIPSSVVFHMDISPECHAVLGDSTQIRQVIINLCNNAAHAMEGLSGALSIRARNISTKTGEIFYDQVLSPGNYVSIEVEDNGHGIASNQLARIFDPFYTTKDVGIGSGMGLSVVQGIMKGHGGGIRISSLPGKGAKVQCLFPSAGKKRAALPEQPPKSPEGDERILFVDDEFSIVKMVKGRLERLGYSVTAMDDPQEAINLYAENPKGFDLVITDLTMPTMTGDILIARLKEINPNVKTIICTGYNEKIDARIAKEMGAGAFLTKPVERHHMAAAIRQVMEDKPLNSEMD
ncbi:MAG: PAS domain S-box protein [Desulfatibacillum sp.]|nr:PAS domain S-box protein [Desulfatibacillum sp.]